MHWKSHRSWPAFSVSCLMLFASALRAEEGHYYGIVESFGGGEVVVKTTQHSTGHWKIGPESRIEGSIARFDWVGVQLGRAGFVAVLRFEERPAGRAGVVHGIHGRVLTVRSGSDTETWNLTEETIGAGEGVAVGDEIGARLYRNHNLAEIHVIKHGVH